MLRATQLVGSGRHGLTDITYVGNQTFTGSASGLRTFTGVNLGDHNGELIVLGITTRRSTNNWNITAVTVDGVAATLVNGSKFDGGGDFQGAYLYRISGITVATATVTVTFSATVDAVNFGVWNLFGVNPVPFSSATDQGAAPSTAIINIPENGLVVGSSVKKLTGTTTWTGATENFDVSMTNQQSSGASIALLAAETGRSISSSTANVCTAASWGP
jgi:hypothetical protein